MDEKSKSLREELSSQPYNTLRKMAKQHSVHGSGKKVVLVEALVKALISEQGETNTQNPADEGDENRQLNDENDGQKLEENNHGESDAEDPVDSNDEEEAVETVKSTITVKVETPAEDLNVTYLVENETEDQKEEDETVDQREDNETEAYQDDDPARYISFTAEPSLNESAIQPTLDHQISKIKIDSLMSPIAKGSGAFESSTIQGQNIRSTSPSSSAQFSPYRGSFSQSLNAKIYGEASKNALMPKIVESPSPKRISEKYKDSKLVKPCIKVPPRNRAISQTNPGDEIPILPKGYEFKAGSTKEDGKAQFEFYTNPGAITGLFKSPTKATGSNLRKSISSSHIHKTDVKRRTMLMKKQSILQSAGPINDMGHHSSQSPTSGRKTTYNRYTGPYKFVDTTKMSNREFEEYKKAHMMASSSQVSQGDQNQDEQ